MYTEFAKNGTISTTGYENRSIIQDIGEWSRIGDFMDNGDNKVNLFKYLDYRTFLRDWYVEAKERYAFSYRVFSRQAGFRSSNIFKLVMDGDRNLTEESLKKFIRGIKLERDERDYFRNLVLFNQAKTHEDKNLYYRKLIRSQQYSQLEPLAQDRYEYFSTWYHPVIRELLVAKDFDGTVEWIAKKLEPEVTPAQVKKSIELLEHLGFVERIDDADMWRQSTSLVTTGPESSSLIMLNYHQSILEMLKGQLPRVAQQNRDVSALTLGVIKKRLPQLKKRIQEFRREILQLVAEDDCPDDVVLLSIQMLPLTKLGNEGKVKS